MKTKYRKKSVDQCLEFITNWEIQDKDDESDAIEVTDLLNELYKKNNNLLTEIVEHICEHDRFNLASYLIMGITFSDIPLSDENSIKLIHKCLESERISDISRGLTTLEILNDSNVNKRFKHKHFENKFLMRRFKDLYK